MYTLSRTVFIYAEFMRLFFHIQNKHMVFQKVVFNKSSYIVPSKLVMMVSGVALWQGSWSYQRSYSTGMGDVSGFDSRRRHFISVCNQPPKANSAFHPFGVDKLSSEQLYRMCAGRTIW